MHAGYWSGEAGSGYRPGKFYRHYRFGHPTVMHEFWFWRFWIWIQVR